MSDSSSVSAHHHPLPPRRVAWRYAITGSVMLALGFTLAWVASAHEPWLRARDLPTNQWFFDLGQASGVLHAIATGVSFIGAGEVTVPILGTVLVALLVARQWRWAIFVLVSSQAGFLLSNTTKLLVHRTRPPFTVVTPRQVGMSFPSGHTFAGIATWGAFAIVAWFLFTRPWSTILATVLAGFGLLNGPARLLLGKHWVSDVLGGLLLGFGWLLVVWAAFVYWLAPRGTATRKEPPDSGDLDAPT